MKKILCFGIFLAAMLAGCIAPDKNTTVQTKYPWNENNFTIGISETEFEGVYGINYLDEDTQQYETFYEKSPAGQIFLLAVNGGYLPVPDILATPKGNIYVPMEYLEPIGITAETIKNEDGTKILLKYGKDTLLLAKNRAPEKNGEAVEIKFPAVEMLDEKIYVPVCFVVEQFGGTVDNIDDFSKEFCNESMRISLKISLIGIEMPMEQIDSFSIEEGLQAVIESSITEYEGLLTLLEERGESFTESDPDYDPRAVCYSGKKFGRYYIYKLSGFEDFPIFFNCYTGEIYGVQPWDIMFSVTQCFPNIRKLY